MDFRVGDYISNPYYGVGLIKEIGEGDIPDVVIDFHREQNMSVSARLIETSSRRLSPDGFLALWFDDKAQADKLISEDPAKAVALALTDFVNTRAKTEELKSYFTPCIPESEWTKWWKKTQQAVKKAEYIDSSKSDDREYRLRQELISQAEEAFRRFQRTRNLGDLKRAYEDTKAIFNAIEKGASLSDLHVQDLKQFYTQVSNDASFDVGIRLDALFRLEERKWLTPEEAHNAQLALVQPAKLYRVETFTETRLLNFLFTNIDNADLYPTLLTGLCSSSTSMERVFDWITKRGDPSLVLAGLRVTLTENIPPELRPTDHKLLATRLDRASQLVELQTMSSESAEEMLVLYEKLVDSIGGAKQIEADTKILIVSAIHLGGVLFDRVVAIQSDLGTRVVAALVVPSFSSDFVFAVLDLRTKARTSEAFNAKLDGYALENSRSTNSSALTVLLPKANDDRVTAMGQLAEMAHRYGNNNEYLLSKIAERAYELCREASKEELMQVIPNLDSLVNMGMPTSSKNLLAEQRKRAYVFALQEYMPRASSPNASSIGVLDRFLALAIRDYMQEQQAEIRTQVAELKKLVTDQEQQAQELTARLAETQSRMKELGQSFVQNPQQMRYEERFRILQDIAASVAEFERFNSKPERKSPESDAFLRRMNSLLSAQGVFPRESIGNVIKYDSTFCQIISGVSSSGSSIDEVKVVERGYVIKDPQGTEHLLKPVLVRLPE